MSKDIDLPPRALLTLASCVIYYPPVIAFIKSIIVCFMSGLYVAKKIVNKITNAKAAKAGILTPRRPTYILFVNKSTNLKNILLDMIPIFEQNSFIHSRANQHFK